MDLLKKAGQDPIMQKAQDQIFDEGYWNPAVSQSEAMGLVLPLSYAIVYDTCIHSGPGGVARIRKLFNEVPPARGGDEKAWARAYINARRNWLLSSSNSLVQKTVYRMDAFAQLMKEDNWELRTPFKVRNVTIST
jgi:chitosanase